MIGEATRTSATAEDLLLGTAQLGGVYGISNAVGVPSQSETAQMVRQALDLGYFGFDTAAEYGSSELNLGDALTLVPVTPKRVVTKVRLLSAAERADPAEARRAIRGSVFESLRRLRVPRLHAVLFHREEDAVHLDVLRELRDEGVLGRIGVSCGHDPDSARAIVSQPGVDIVQLPVSLLDPRHVLGGAIDAAAERGVEVHVRSVFLQGLLLMPEEVVPPALRAVLPIRQKLAALAAEAGVELSELAVHSMLTLPGRIRLVLGAESVAQVRANAALVAHPGFPDELARAARLIAGTLPAEVITPRSWLK